MAFAVGNDAIDVVNTAYISGTLSVSTSQALAKVGASNLENRQFIIIHNPVGNDIVYYGPTGVTIPGGANPGIPITGGESVSFPYGSNINIYLIKTGASQSVRIQELS